MRLCVNHWKLRRSLPRAEMKIRIGSEQFENALVVVLRTPGLFMLDQWWQHYRDEVKFRSDDVKTLMPSMISILMACGGFLLATLRLEALVAVYMHLLSGALLVVADLFSRYYVYAEQDRLEGDVVTSPVRHAAALISHLVFATIISFLLEIRDDRKRCMLVLYCLPVVARIAGYPPDLLLVVHNFVSAFIVLVTIYYVIVVVIPACVEWAKDRWDEAAGTGHVEGGVFILETSPMFGFDGLLASQFLLLWAYLFVSNLYLVGCGSPVSVAATGVAIARLSRLILFLVKVYLAGGFNSIRGQTISVYQESLLQCGWTEGFTFTLLAFQANLSEIAMPEKAALMSIILFIVLSSMVQSLFEVTEPVVMSLGASEVRLDSASISRHIRAVVLCVALFISPLYMTYVLNRILDLDFWSLVVISTCLVTSVQVFGLLVTYCLFLYDLVRDEPWEKLDDVVYGARAMTRVLEFFIALFVVGIGVKESMLGSEEWSIINCSIVFVHCYFNVWQRLQAGWDSFLRRRAASQKVGALPLAAASEGKRFNDSCPICFGELLDDGRILPCLHVFHRGCLQKWFYVREKCPICQTPVFVESEARRTVTEASG